MVDPTGKRLDEGNAAVTRRKAAAIVAAIAASAAMPGVAVAAQALSTSGGGERGHVAKTSSASSSAVDASRSGAETPRGDWKVAGVRRGVTAFAGNNGAVRLVTSYFSADVPGEFMDGSSWRYDEDVAAYGEADADGRPNMDQSTWSVCGADLFVAAPDGGAGRSFGVCVARVGDDSNGTIGGGPGQVTLDLGEAAVGGGWHVYAYAWVDFGAGENMEDHKPTDAFLDQVSSWVTTSGSWDRPPEMPSDVVPKVGG